MTREVLTIIFPTIERFLSFIILGTLCCLQRVISPVTMPCVEQSNKCVYDDDYEELQINQLPQKVFNF